MAPASDWASRRSTSPVVGLSPAETDWMRREKTATIRFASTGSPVTDTWLPRTVIEASVEPSMRRSSESAGPMSLVMSMESGIVRRTCAGSMLLLPLFLKIILHFLKGPASLGGTNGRFTR